MPVINRRQPPRNARLAETQRKDRISRYVNGLIRAKLEDADETTVDTNGDEADEKGSGGIDARDTEGSSQVNPNPQTQVQPLDDKGSTEKGKIGEKNRVRRFKVATEGARQRTINYLRENGYQIVARKDSAGNVVAMWKKLARREGMDPDSADAATSMVNQGVATQSPGDAGRSVAVDQGGSGQPDDMPNLDGIPDADFKRTAWDEPDLQANGNTASGGGATAAGGGGGMAMEDIFAEGPGAMDSALGATAGPAMGADSGSGGTSDGQFYVVDPDGSVAGGPFTDASQAQQECQPGQSVRTMGNMQREKGGTTKLVRVSENTGGAVINGDWVYVYAKGNKRKVDSGTVEKVQRGSGTVTFSLMGGKTQYDINKYDVVKMA